MLDRDFQEAEAGIGTVAVRYDTLNSLSLRSRTRVGRTANRYGVSAPGWPDTGAPDPAEWTVSANPKNRNSKNDYVANISDATFRFATGGIEPLLGLRYDSFDILATGGTALAIWQATDTLMVGGQTTVRSAIFGGTQAAGDTRVSGYARFDAVARYDIGNRLQLRLNLLNLADTLYYDTRYRSGTPFVYVALGRSATMSLTAGF